MKELWFIRVGWDRWVSVERMKAMELSVSEQLVSVAAQKMLAHHRSAILYLRAEGGSTEINARDLKTRRWLWEIRQFEVFPGVFVDLAQAVVRDKGLMGQSAAFWQLLPLGRALHYCLSSLKQPLPTQPSELAGLTPIETPREIVAAPPTKQKEPVPAVVEAMLATWTEKFLAEFRAWQDGQKPQKPEEVVAPTSAKRSLRARVSSQKVGAPINPGAVVCTVQQARYLLGGMGNTKFYELMAAGKFDVRRSGRRTLIKVESVKAYVAALPAVELKPSAQQKERSK